MGPNWPASAAFTTSGVDADRGRGPEKKCSDRRECVHARGVGFLEQLRLMRGSGVQETRLR